MPPKPRRFDLVVSNPPYIPSTEVQRLPALCSQHAPRESPGGGPDGLHLVRALMEQAGCCLRPGGWLAPECDTGQAERVRMALSAAGRWRQCRILCAGRVILAR